MASEDRLGQCIIHRLSVLPPNTACRRVIRDQLMRRGTMSREGNHYNVVRIGRRQDFRKLAGSSPFIAQMRGSGLGPTVRLRSLGSASA
jgi:hypothetical protein